MARILITDGIEMSTASELRNKEHEIVEAFYAPDQLRVQILDFDAVIVRSATKITQDIIDAALQTKRLKLIVRGGVGVDNIDVKYAQANGICVENTPNASSRSVAELTIAHIFALARYVFISNVTMRQGLWEKKKYEGVEVYGKMLGLIGFGRIAIETAKIARSLGMQVQYFTRSGRKEQFPEFKYVSLDELLRTSDFISLHCPVDNDKGALLGEREFNIIKDGSYLINCSRGGVVDEDALLTALDAGKIAGAALDVFSQEPVKNEKIYTHQKISLTPHIGASTVEAQKKIGKEIIEIIDKHFGGK